MLLHGTAPSKTRGSFVAAALSTLQLFINEYVANCTQKSDFDLRQFAREKTAIYVLLPDDRETYHKLASLLVQQIYTSLVELSRQEGGELQIRMNFVLDEFANFTKIDTFQSIQDIVLNIGMAFTKYRLPETTRQLNFQKLRNHH